MVSIQSLGRMVRHKAVAQDPGRKRERERRAQDKSQGHKRDSQQSSGGTGGAPECWQDVQGV